MADRPTGTAPSRLVAVLGPTNTGKTHLAVERMLAHASGMIGLPLRLLAREIYDRAVKLRGARSVALITGEEKIVPPRAVFFVCTVEAMPIGRSVEFLAVDEIQLCADPARGHVFTHRLLHARGTAETMFLGSASVGPLIRRLLPGVEFQSRERFSALTYAGSKKLTRLPRRSAVVAFSADNVYAIAELIRRQRGGAAVVMGSLSPRTRNAQVALYQSGEVDFLVATDAIGMGLNMDVDHVAFAGLRKFDGKRTRWLHPAEVGQIAGRAGRYRRDGTFGVTGEAEDMDEDLVSAVEDHRYEPLAAAEWRSAELDFASLKGLMRSLAAPPARDGLKLAEESLDETTLRQIARDDGIEGRIGADRGRLRRLWEVCQTPDFRKTTLDEHLRLCRTVFEHLSSRNARMPEDWIAGQFAGLDHAGGEIDVLAQRLAGVRTLAYVANRPDWLRDPAHWQGKTRALEDRLSDTLHERLMQRFIDRRTSALLRGLNAREEVLAGVAADGAVTVEGHFVGRLDGVRFERAEGATQLEDKALRAAAQRAVAPELTRRLGALAADADSAFQLRPDGLILWNGEPAGRLVGGAPFAPVCAVDVDLASDLARDRARRRLEAFVAAEAGVHAAPLRALEEALADGGLRGLARGVVYRLLEAGGVLARRDAAREIAGLSKAERRVLRGMGVRFGAFSLHLPALATPPARRLLSAFADVEAPKWRPDGAKAFVRPLAAPSPRASGWRGYVAVGELFAAVETLEAVADAVRAAPREAGAVRLELEALAPLGLEPDMAARLLKVLGFRRVRRTGDGGGALWRAQRPPHRDEPVAAPRTVATTPPDGPFAALAALKAPERRPRRRRRHGRARAAATGGGAASGGTA